MILLVLGGIAALAFLLSHLFEGGGQGAVLVWFGGCGLSLALPLLAGGIAIKIFRGVATPLADVMAAADAVAEGDLSVRVSNRAPGEFGQLVRSFNRMIEELEQADRRRRNLTADVAHELRTPLHIIRGNLEGILDGVYEPTGKRITATLDETLMLARLVDDLQTLSLAEAGQLPLTRETIDAFELLADARTSFSGQAEASGIELRVEAEAADPLYVTVDVGRLDQVLSNLIANALRHTPAGGTITLKAEPAPEGVCLTVRDTGEGISAEDLPYIFDRFWRGDRSRSHAGGAGSGLGLDQLSVPLSELSFRFTPSGGPGGQHANRSATQVELLFDVDASSSLDEAQRRRVKSRLKRYLNKGGELRLTVRGSRSQSQNRQEAKTRFQALMAQALKRRARRRRTCTPRRERERRLANKRHRSEKKQFRKQVRREY